MVVNKSINWNKQQGAALVEFAMVLPLLLFLTVGLVEFSNAYMQLNNLNKSVREGIAYFSRKGVDATQKIVTLTSADGIALKNETKQFIKNNFEASSISVKALATTEPTPFNFTIVDPSHLEVSVTYCHPLLLGHFLNDVTSFFGGSLGFSGCALEEAFAIPLRSTAVYRVI